LSPSFQASASWLQRIALKEGKCFPSDACIRRRNEPVSCCACEKIDAPCHHEFALPQDSSLSAVPISEIVSDFHARSIKLR